MLVVIALGQQNALFLYINIQLLKAPFFAALVMKSLTVDSSSLAKASV
jgi:hypothetical protein